MIDFFFFNSKTTGAHVYPTLQSKETVGPLTCKVLWAQGFTSCLSFLDESGTPKGPGFANSTTSVSSASLTCTKADENNTHLRGLCGD